MPSAKERYILAANDLEKLGTQEAYAAAQQMKATAMHLPPDAMSTEDAAKKHDEKTREAIALRIEIAGLENKGDFNAAAPLKTKLSHLVSNS
jgi:hypothetical protein